MTKSLALTREALFENSDAQDLVTGFLARALANKQTVRLTLTDNGGAISSENFDPGAQLRVRGRWRAAERPPAETTGTGVGLLLPLVFYIQDIRLPAREFATLGKDNRPVADIFAESLLNATLRESHIDWETGSWFRPSASQAFAERYLMLLRHNLTEPAFVGLGPTECMNVALSALFLSEPVFKNPLLMLGNHRLSESIRKGALRRKFKSARTEVLRVVAS